MDGSFYMGKLISIRHYSNNFEIISVVKSNPYRLSCQQKYDDIIFLFLLPKY